MCVHILFLSSSPVVLFSALQVYDMYFWSKWMFYHAWGWPTHNPLLASALFLQHIDIENVHEFPAIVMVLTNELRSLFQSHSSSFLPYLVTSKASKLPNNGWLHLTTLYICVCVCECGGGGGWWRWGRVLYCVWIRKRAQVHCVAECSGWGMWHV